MLAALTIAAVTALPTISITVQPSSKVSRTLVALVLEEASTIWRDAGVRVVWTIDGGEGRAKSPRHDTHEDHAHVVPYETLRNEPAPDVVRVVIDDQTGTTLDAGLTIGWVIFEDDKPRPEIHLSYANALTGLERSCRVGALSRMWRSEIDEVVAVALGRALAHELGHYLLGLNSHSGGGLMHADWSPGELFGADRPHFRLDAAQRAAIASKLRPAQIGTKR